MNVSIIPCPSLCPPLICIESTAPFSSHRYRKHDPSLLLNLTQNRGERDRTARPGGHREALHALTLCCPFRGNRLYYYLRSVQNYSEPECEEKPWGGGGVWTKGGG
uniref:Uncharacterized protein n=1 Tax=Knipowitschia caucasica TaxID=637954 RepID=A0AAV2J1Q5_KNICA